jgi:hypothetical protein
MGPFQPTHTRNSGSFRSYGLVANVHKINKVESVPEMRFPQ